MYAIAFDLEIDKLKEHYPKAHTQAYYDLRILLRGLGFYHIQGSVYIQREIHRLPDGSDDSMLMVLQLSNKLKELDWLPSCVRDIRIFKVENWSDITAFIKG
ncbi:MAG: hypothetical protein J6N92_05555 [Alloprevotella sp.]|nr:hypothetical protein [Alloprevotella sp.]